MAGIQYKSCKLKVPQRLCIKITFTLSELMDTESYHGNSPWVNTLANGVSKRQQGEY